MVPKVRILRDTLDAKAQAFAHIVKIGRTHLAGRDAAHARPRDQRMGFADRPRPCRPSTPRCRSFESLRSAAPPSVPVSTHTRNTPIAVAAKISELSGKVVRFGAQQVCGTRGPRRFRRHERGAEAVGRGSDEDRERCPMAFFRDLALASASFGFRRTSPAARSCLGKVNPTQCEAMTMVVHAGHGKRCRPSASPAHRATSSSMCTSP